VGTRDHQRSRIEGSSSFQALALCGTYNHNDNDNPKYWTFDSLMSSHWCARDFLLSAFSPLIGLLSGHTFIDILKIDIEGGEFDALATFLAAHAEDAVFPVGQLQLEIHARDGHENFEYFARWWATLEAAGLRPFWTELNLVYVNIVRGVRPELAEVSSSICFRSPRGIVLNEIRPPSLQYSSMNIRGDHALVNEAFN
jgi:hypothetical protein